MEEEEGGMLLAATAQRFLAIDTTHQPIEDQSIRFFQL